MVLKLNFSKKNSKFKIIESYQKVKKIEKVEEESISNRMNTEKKGCLRLIQIMILIKTQIKNKIAKLIKKIPFL